METGAGFDCDVVIPTHGRNPELLAETIRSVAGQTLAPVRILVVVDGNPPAAREIRARHSEVEVIAQPHQGVAAARQKGVDAATSRWIAFVDDDDLWLPEKKAVTARYLHAHPDCLAVRAGYWMFTAPDSPIDGLNGQTVEPRASTLDDLLGALPDAAGSVLAGAVTGVSSALVRASWVDVDRRNGTGGRSSVRRGGPAAQMHSGRRPTARPLEFLRNVKPLGGS